MTEVAFLLHCYNSFIVSHSRVEREKRKNKLNNFNFSDCNLVKVIIRFFSFKLELICTSEFFKKLKLHEPFRRVQFQLFEKLTSAN